jgi:hypothetical protein
MAVTAARKQGKSMFVKEVLHDNPSANAQAVNDAWKSAGMDGTISGTLVSKIRSGLGLTKKRRRRRSAKAQSAAATAVVTAGPPKRRGRPPKSAAIPSNGMSMSSTRGRKTSLAALEVEFDRLLLKVVESGTLPEVEVALRKARRLLYSALPSEL